MEQTMQEPKRTNFNPAGSPRKRRALRRPSAVPNGGSDQPRRTQPSL